jgi:hypothetical protein
MGSHMVCKMTFYCEAFSALLDWTYVGSIGDMKKEMSSKITILSEPLVADIALKGFLSSMSSFMDS